MCMDLDQTFWWNLGFTFLCDLSRLDHLSMSHFSHLSSCGECEDNVCEVMTQCLACSKSSL